MFMHTRNSLPVAAIRTSAAMLLTIATVVGCHWQQPAEQKKEQAEDAKKQKKPPFEIGLLRSQLDQDIDKTPSEGPAILVKPGHWTPTLQTMQANRQDFVGQSSFALIDQQNQPVPLEHTGFSFAFTRPVVLAQGRAKQIEGLLLVPEQTRATRVRATLVNRDTGSQVHQIAPRLVALPSYQYYVVVLAREATRYAFLRVTDTVRAPWEEEFDEASAAHYRVVLADATKRLPLPDSALTWSSIAYLVWDEVDPTRLSAEQQNALLDWLHWGGRLIVSGPDSLDTLRGSFLDDLLPAESGGQRQITADDLRRWAAYWSPSETGDKDQERWVLAPGAPWSGVRLEPRAEARELAGGGQLFYERDVGRGSIVVSAMQLAERALINWPGYDGFLNGALWRRPRRRFAAGPYGGVRVDWADFSDRRIDAHFTTGWRLFARDAATQANVRPVAAGAAGSLGGPNAQVRPAVDRPGGLGAWSESSPLAAASRASLREAAGVRVVGAGFVLGALAVYLVVLVPLNWMVFHALERVEWAWVAAPVIAVLGTIAVVRQAQLDIGFVRSHTEVALLELQGAYPRGILSRYTALYTSLSTSYDLTFDDPTAVAAPFAVDDQMREILSNVVLEKQRTARLRGLEVSSASTKMVHSEQLFSLQGPLRLGTSSRGHLQVENRSGYDLREAAVVRRRFDKQGQAVFDGCWIGPLRNGNSAVLGFAPVRLAKERLLFESQRRQSDVDCAAEPFNVDTLLELAFQFPGDDDPFYAKREEIRLVASIDDLLPGVEIRPAASQTQAVTIVLAHLQYGNPPRPRPDVNSRGEVKSEK